MAEPLAALATLGTVSNIIQVLDFSAKVIQQIHKVASGAQEASEDAKRIERLAEQYQKLSINICEHNQYSKPLTADETAVDELARESWAAANALLKLTNGLKVDKSSRGVKRALHGGIKVIKTAKQKRNLDQQEKNLQNLNDQLGTSFLNLLQQNLKNFHEDVLSKVDSLDRRSGDTIRTIIDCRDKILSAVNQKRHEDEKRVRVILDNLAFHEMKTRRHNISATYARTYEWAFTETAWGLRDWLSGEAGLFWVSGKAGSGKSTLMKFLIRHAETRHLLELWAGDGILCIADFYFWYLGTTELQKSEEGLLRSLLYQVLSDCPYLIPDVCSDERWCKAVNPKFEPWTREELYQMMDNLASSGSIPSNTNRKDGEFHPRSASDTVLHPATGTSSRQRKFALFIDGLDEYGGDQRRLVGQIKRLAASPSFKLCVSSRPENIFNNLFREIDSTLRLEDLTKPDIHEYVRGNILSALGESRTSGSAKSEKKFPRISKKITRSIVLDDLEYNSSPDSKVQDVQHPSLANDRDAAQRSINDPSQLIEQVVSKASGVFLWVYLVVTSIVNGIGEGDSVTRLSKRIDTFPSDLYEYFKHTLNRVDGIYAPQTAHALLMARTIVDDKGANLVGENAGSFLTYWLLKQSEDDLPHTLDVDLHSLSHSTWLEMQHETQRFLSATSKDLLQLSRDGYESSIHTNHKIPFYGKHVEFLHRSVYEFLCHDYMQSLLDQHDKPIFRDTRFWCRLAVARLKLVLDAHGHERRFCDRLASCVRDYFFAETDYILKCIPWFQSTGSQSQIIADFDLEVEQWLRLDCLYGPSGCNSTYAMSIWQTANPIGQLLSGLAAWHCRQSLAMLISRENFNWEVFGTADRKPFLLVLLGLFEVNGFRSSKIDVSILEAALNEKRSSCHVRDSSEFSIWQKFIRKVVVESDLSSFDAQGAPGQTANLSDITREVIALLVRYGADTEADITLPSGRIWSSAEMWPWLGIDPRSLPKDRVLDSGDDF